MYYQTIVRTKLRSDSIEIVLIGSVNENFRVFRSENLPW